MKQILINSEELQTRVAVVKNGILQDFFMERTHRDRIVGSIYKAKIKNLEPSLQAAFVDIGCGKNAFLHYWDMLPASQDILEEELFNEPNDDKIVPLAEPAAKQYQRAKKPATNSPQEPQQNKNLNQTAVKTTTNLSKKGGFFSRLRSKLLPFIAETTESTTESPTTDSKRYPSKKSNPRYSRNKNNSNKVPNGLVPLVDAVPSTPQQPAQQSRNSHPTRRKKRPQRIMPSINEIPDLFKVDQEILVQVTKGPIGTKGARVSTNLSIPGRYLVLLPNSTHIGVSRRVEERSERDRLRQMMRGFKLPRNMGLICRTAGVGVKQEHFQRDLDLLLECWESGKNATLNKRAPVCVYQEPNLTERTLRDCLTEDVDEIITDSQETYTKAESLLKRYNCLTRVSLKHYNSPVPIFNKYNLMPQIENISNRRVTLPNGGYICIDETEALIAIDINTGKNRSGKDQPETILTTNLEAVAEIAHQLRLRNIGGIVILDLIDMRTKKDQLAVYKALRNHLAEDRAKIKTYPISSLGLVEMTRQRENESLESTIYDDCPYCKGRGLVKSTITMSAEIQRHLNEILGRRQNIQQLKILVHPKILERLRNKDRNLIDAMAKQFTCELTFRSDAELHIESFKILDPSTNKEL